MDDDRFDSLTRALAAPGGSRRRLLAGLAAAAGALLGGFGPEDAAAHDALRACRRIASARKRRACVRRARAHNLLRHCTTDADCDDGDPCTEDICDGAGLCTNQRKADGTDCLGAQDTPGVCCGGACRRCCTNAHCPAGSNEVCEGGSCVCSNGGLSCSGTCCARGQACTGGSCGVCPSGIDVCAGTGPLPRCGSSPDCYCVTSVEGDTACVDGDGVCAACSTDATCTTLLGESALCIAAACACPEEGTLCVPATCPAHGAAAVTTAGRGSLLGGR